MSSAQSLLSVGFSIKALALRPKRLGPMRVARTGLIIANLDLVFASFLVCGYACATRNFAIPMGWLARLVPPVTTPPSEVGFAPFGGERGWSPQPYIICAVLFDLGLFSFICAICVDLDQPRLFAALVI